jgi:hypothetical protein
MVQNTIRSVSGRTSCFVLGAVIGVCVTLSLNGATPRSYRTSTEVDIVALQTSRVSQPTTLPHSTSSNDCVWEFQRYVPSPLETEWWQNIEALKKDSCHFTMGKYKKWLYDGVYADISGFVPDKLPPGDAIPRQSCTDGLTDPHLEKLRNKSYVYSRFEYKNSCTQERYSSPIEPLAGPLRHPRLCAPGWRDPDVIRRDWLVIDPWLPRLTLSNRHKRIYVDAGSSTWFGDAVMGSSQVWFWSLFARWCAPFTSIHAWEKKVFAPERVFRHIPAMIRPNYHWYNIPATTGAEDGDNPLFHLLKVAVPQDYVLFKLDIDHNPTEEKIVDLMLANSTMLSLIDEFFWEHHVVFPAMQRAWGLLPDMKDQGTTIELLTKMRRAGVRAHSWV